jgi:hypothetical protein
LADHGYFSEANGVHGGEHRAADCDRAAAASSLLAQTVCRAASGAGNPTPVEAMAWRLRTPQGKQLYGLRKQTPEPVFGIIKSHPIDPLDRQLHIRGAR